MRGALLAASAALALVPAIPAAWAGELGGEESCSRADAHATQPHDGASTPAETAEAALAVEATRPLPAVERAGPVQDERVEAAGETIEAMDPTAVAAGRAATVELEPGRVDLDASGHGIFTRLPDGFVPPTAAASGPLAAARAAGLLDGAGAAPLGFRDSAAPRERLRDLKRLRELKLLRLFDTSELMVWLGLDRKGRPGLHFRQRNPGEDLPPPAQAAFLSDPPPLRSVPLTAP
jgi:hypothetical protein